MSTLADWLVIRYSPAALFSLKVSRATSTAGETLLIPTPYAVKMAFVDAALRHNLTHDPDALVRDLAEVILRIGVPREACVTGTIQTIRQETREAERRQDPAFPPYRANIAMREFVHYQGRLRLALHLQAGQECLLSLLLRAAPAINYLGKRGSFVQYLDHGWMRELDSTFTRPARDDGGNSVQYATLDDFGTEASFQVLNSFSPTEVRPEVHRRFVDSVIPFEVYNFGPGFVHYRATGAIL
jgi:hypothetical protein